MDQLLSVLSYLAFLSVAVERLIDILKGVLGRLSGTAAKTVYHVTAVALGALLCYAAPPELPFDMPPIVTMSVVGLLVSSGSGVWHDVLSTLTAFKERSR